MNNSYSTSKPNYESTQFGKDLVTNVSLALARPSYTPPLTHSLYLGNTGNELHLGWVINTGKTGSYNITAFPYKALQMNVKCAKKVNGDQGKELMQDRAIQENRL